MLFEEFFYQDNNKLLYLLTINWPFICPVYKLCEPYNIMQNNNQNTLVIIVYYAANIYVEDKLHKIKNAINIFLCRNFIYTITIKVDTYLLQMYNHNTKTKPLNIL